MPSYIYKAVTENGQIVRNRVEDVSRLSLMKKLKRNNLTPITIVQSTIKRKNDTKIVSFLFCINIFHPT